MDQSPGRIIYEENSECFFVRFFSSDIDGDKPVHRGDEVSFLLAKDPTLVYSSTYMYVCTYVDRHHVGCTYVRTCVRMCMQSENWIIFA